MEEQSLQTKTPVPTAHLAGFWAGSNVTFQR